jgi:uncharacterized protein (DUF2147 family)
MTFSDIRSHMSAWMTSMAMDVNHEWAHAVDSFVTWAESKEAERTAAIALLTTAGYTVTPPSA